MENITEKPQEKSFINMGNKLYETVYVEPLGTTGYYYFDRDTKERGFVKQATTEQIDYESEERSCQIFIPPVNNLAENGTMLFPEKTSDYGSLLKLVRCISDFINKYLELPPDVLLISSYYVVLTWVYDCFDTIPYLRARGEYGTGKTRFLRVIGSLCYRALFAGGASTTSPIFRLIELYGGLTLILDEADFRFSGPDSEMIKILNTGYMKGIGVLRTEGEKVRTPRAFNTFGPKILATRKEFDDQALESRCLTTFMTGMTRTDIPIALPKSFAHEALAIRNKLLLFRFEHYGLYEIDQSLAVAGVEPRVNQVLLPLLALADSETVREELRSYAKKHAATQAARRSDTLEADILQVIVELSKDNHFLSYKDIAGKLAEQRDKSEYAVSPSKIGRINKVSFGFESRRINGGTQIIWSTSIGQRLCERYNIPFIPPVNDVNEVNLVDACAKTFLEGNNQTEGENV